MFSVAASTGLAFDDAGGFGLADAFAGVGLDGLGGRELGGLRFVMARKSME